MPHLPDVGILALLPDRFDSFWMARHQIMARLARYYTVLWMNPARDWRAALRRPPTVEGAPEPGLGIEVREPEPWLPVFHRPAWLGRATDVTRLRRARRRLQRLGARTIVLHVWRPLFAPALERVDHDFSLYHVVDEYTFSHQEVPIPEDERHLLTHADAVIVHSPGLMERKGSLNPTTYQIPNGVDFEAVTATGPEPADLADVPHPRIGYSGRLKRQMDWELVRALVERHPDWSFVFAGAAAPRPDLLALLRELDERPNVYLLGPKRSHELVRYPKHFDVCVMPYRITPYTNCIYPLKLHDYLASGRPVVGTPIRTLRDFAGVVALAEGPDAWSAALEAALREAPERALRRVETARRHDWDRIVHRVAAVIARGLGAEVQSRFEAIPHPEAWDQAEPFVAQR